MSIQRIKSKLAKTEVLLRHAKLRDCIPHTEPFTSASLAAMLKQYGMVYVKPDGGSFGSGVIRVEAASGNYTAQLGTKLHHFGSTDQLYNGLLEIKSRGRYVIQRGIELLRHRNRRFDVRVMVQRNPRGRWETTGIIGRLSHPKRIVTNYHSGGTPLAFSTLVAGHLSLAEQRRFMRRLRQLGTTVATQLTTKYPRLCEIGIDVAIDKSLKPWILEVNTMPDPFIFKRLRDRSIFRNIYRYAQAYGRFRRLPVSRRAVRAYRKTARYRR